MSSNNKENKKYFRNFLSFCIIIVFIICECLYFNTIFVSDFKSKIDNLPSNINSFVSEKLKGISPSKDIQDNNDINIVADINNNYDKSKNETTKEQSVERSKNIENNDIIVEDDDIKSTDTSNLLDENNENQVTDTPIREKKLKYMTTDLSYFNNSLFIGDSRMQGFKIYQKIPGASYFCYSSASVLNIFDKEESVDGFGNIKLLDLLSKHKFDKIYIMLGINNLQINYYSHKAKYKEMLDTISTLQPGAIIYVIANFHLTDIEDPTKPYLNNKNINDVNAFIKEYADNAQIFYLDSNPMYDDENGNLKLELSTDNVHIHIVHYDKFLFYLLSNALVEDTDASNIIMP